LPDISCPQVTPADIRSRSDLPSETFDAASG
jgi:hypothetical protein